MSSRLSERALRAVTAAGAHPRVRILALLAVSVIWGGGYVGTALAIGDGFGPMWFQSSRLLVAGLLLTVVAWRAGCTFPRGGTVVVTGLLAWGVTSGAQTLAQQTISPGTAALVMGSGPLVAVALDSALRRVRPRYNELSGLLLGLIGLGLLVGAGPRLDPAIGLLLAACLGWSVASVWESRRRDDSHPLAVAAVQMLVGAAGLGALALVTGEPLPNPGLSGWLGWSWLAFACATFGMPVWLWVLRVLPMSTVMLQASLSPLAASLLAALVMGERWTAMGFVGMGCIVVAAAVTVAWPVRRPMVETGEPTPSAAPARRWRRAA